MCRLLLVALAVGLACRRDTDPERDLALLSRPVHQSSTASVPSQARGAEASCMDYRDTVTIRGIVRREVYAGPPNYESVAAGDAPEAGFYLHLSQAICARSARGGTADASLQPVDRARRVQLVLASAGFASLRPQLGQVVELRGTLFSAYTGHHHAPLLLSVVW